MTTSNGAVRGATTTTRGAIPPFNEGKISVDFGYTGHYFHEPSGLNLAMFRAYNPALGRWINRDPLEDAEMSQRPNLYAYVLNNPINAFDPDGRDVTSINDENYRWATGMSDAEANRQIAKQNQLLDEGIKNILGSLLDALNICKKAATTGKPVVDIAIEKGKKAMEEKVKEDLKKKLSPPTSTPTGN